MDQPEGSLCHVKAGSPMTSLGWGNHAVGIDEQLMEQDCSYSVRGLTGQSMTTWCCKSLWGWYQ